MPITASDVPH